MNKMDINIFKYLNAFSIAMIFLIIGCKPEPTFTLEKSNFLIKSEGTQAPVIGLNNINLPPTLTSETRTLNVIDVDSKTSDLRVFFDRDKLKNKIIVKNSNGISAEIKCGGETGDINPLQCQFTLLSPTLKSVSEIFILDFQVRDVTLNSSGIDIGKASEVGKMAITFNRDIIPIDAKDTNCSFILNQKEASCDIQSFALNESISEDVNVTLANALTNAGDLITCEKIFVNQLLSINCSLKLQKELISYPLQKDFVANFNITNTSNSALSMKATRKITFSFAKELAVYTKKQLFLTSNTAQFSGVDILWVVDNSGSMGQYQSALTANFPSFIESFVPLKNGVRTTPYPFKMTAITTDAYLQNLTSNSSICSFIKCSSNENPLIVNDLLAKDNFNLFKQNFESIIQVGTSGSSAEKSIKSMSTFIDQNPSWTNLNNLLVIIFMSDELEQSYASMTCPLPSSTKPSPLDAPFSFTPACASERIQWSIAQITKLKARKDLIKVHSIIDYSQDVGKVYQEVSKEFSGNYQSLSTPFSTLLSQIGSSITETFLEYPLIFQGTFKALKSVKVDGVILSNLNNENYVFVAPNKVKLMKNPGEGKSLEVEFEYTNNIY